MGVIWFVVVGWLWNLNPQGLLFVLIISVINLVFLGLALLGQSTFQSIMWPALVNILALVLANLPSTKAAFGQ